jgi:hypothetical protein
VRADDGALRLFLRVPNDLGTGGASPGRWRWPLDQRAISACPGLAFHYPYPHLEGSGATVPAARWHQASWVRTVRGSGKTVRKERRGQRMRRLENEVARVRAGQAELVRRVELFEKIAAAAGAEFGDTVATEPVPASLPAAAQDPHQDGGPVRLDVDGHDADRRGGRRGRRGRRSARMVVRDPAPGVRADGLRSAQ